MEAIKTEQFISTKLYIYKMLEIYIEIGNIEIEPNEFPNWD